MCGCDYGCLGAPTVSRSSDPAQAEQLRMLPKELVADAEPLFVETGTSRNS